METSANSILEPCRDSVSYIGGTAIGLGLTGRRPDILAKDLMQVKLYRNSQCRNTLAKYKIWVDEKMQVCYGSRRSDRAGWIFFHFHSEDEAEIIPGFEFLIICFLILLFRSSLYLVCVI